MMNLKMIGLMMLISNLGCTQSPDFKSERISKTASFVANGAIEEVFPLFGAFEERKWAEGWDPEIIYPKQELMEEGTTFKVGGHGHESLWIVTKYELENYLVQYLVSTENRFWTITVKCDAMVNSAQTKATVTYTYTGLNEEGNQKNQESLHHMYSQDLKDWGEAINAYLSK